MFKKSFVLALAILPCLALAESNPTPTDRYKWHDAPLTNGQVAVVKQDYFFTDATIPGHNIAERNEARMLIEKVMLNGRKAIRVFEVHGWPICPPAPATCAAFVGEVKHRRNSMDFEKGEVYHGAMLVGKGGRDAYLTNDYIVDMVWSKQAFTINTPMFADRSNGNAALFSERANEFMTTLKNDSDAGFSKMGSGAFNGVVRKTTDGLWAGVKRSEAVRDDRDFVPATSSPRVVNQ